MKRPNKCVNKKKYNNRGIAIRYAKEAYEKRGVKLAVYTCPVCLDFHLTSKYTNLEKYYRRWELRNQVAESVRVKSEIKKQVTKEWNEFCRLEAIMERKLNPLPTIKITGTKKQNTLPLVEQRRILAELNNTDLSLNYITMQKQSIITFNERRIQEADISGAREHSQNDSWRKECFKRLPQGVLKYYA